MFYDARKKDHGLPHDPFKAIVAPRPIGWITSMSKSGAINLAPYSYFNGVNSRPPMVMFSSEGHKDSVTFIEETGEFVCNLATWDLREAMNMTSAPLPRGTNEMEKAGLEAAPMPHGQAAARRRLALRARMQAATDRAAAAISTGEPLDSHVVFGQVVGVHIDDRFIKDGLLDTAAMKPIARCGYHNYAVVESQFSMIRPTAG